MKSIVEEASSIAKALEAAWVRAGKPKNFSVSVYQEAQRNLFGFTKQNAKVGIFFEEKAPSVQKRKAEKEGQKEVKRDRKQTPTWNDEMLKYAREWLTNTISSFERDGISFQTSVSGSYLRVTLSASPTGDSVTDKMVFRSFSHLLGQSLRAQFKKPFRYIKIVFN